MHDLAGKLATGLLLAVSLSRCGPPLRRPEQNVKKQN